jgi:hypothetical protein
MVRSKIKGTFKKERGSFGENTFFGGRGAVSEENIRRVLDLVKFYIYIYIVSLRVNVRYIAY